ncbi:MAG TPA: hypothetical protein VFS00_30855 [Polyangiaceae bacterium]|nr:hypothetical protein [Polyangiaceae bacterium]
MRRGLSHCTWPDSAKGLMSRGAKRSDTRVPMPSGCIVRMKMPSAEMFASDA